MDAIDFSAVTILNSPDVRDWPVTATITKLALNGAGVHVEFTKRDGPNSWPDVPFGAPGDSLQYTLWIVLAIDGRWYASGCIEFWRGLDRNGGPPSKYAENWYYDANRWRPMTGHQPDVGEKVGFLVTAGDARNNGRSIVQERSNVVLVSFPSDVGWTYTFEADPAPAPAPAPPPPAPIPDPVPSLELALILNTVALKDLTKRLDTLILNGLRVRV